jgi:hypothetical protein
MCVILKIYYSAELDCPCILACQGACGTLWKEIQELREQSLV